MRSQTNDSSKRSPAPKPSQDLTSAEPMDSDYYADDFEEAKPSEPVSKNPSARCCKAKQSALLPAAVDSGTMRSNSQNVPRGNAVPITLETFDPFNPNCVLSSPKSLRVCSNAGVRPEELYHVPIKKIKGNNPTSAFTLHIEKIQGQAQRENMEYVRTQYVLAENRRKRLVSRLIGARRKLVGQTKERQNKSFTLLSPVLFRNLCVKEPSTMSFSPINIYMKEQRQLQALHARQMGDIAEIAKAEERRKRAEDERQRLEALKAKRDREQAQLRRQLYDLVSSRFSPSRYRRTRCA